MSVDTLVENANTNAYDVKVRWRKGGMGTDRWHSFRLLSSVSVTFSTGTPGTKPQDRVLQGSSNIVLPCLQDWLLPLVSAQLAGPGCATVLLPSSGPLNSWVVEAQKWTPTVSLAQTGFCSLQPHSHPTGSPASHRQLSWSRLPFWFLKFKFHWMPCI